MGLLQTNVSGNGFIMFSDHQDDHHHDDDDEEVGHRFALKFRIAVAASVLIAAGLAACVVMVPASEAMVITRFGNPVRVITQPGLALKLPTPIEMAIPIDLRLRTTSTGLQDVGTKDGLRVLTQSYAAWRVSNEPDRIVQFLRSVRNDPDEAALQLRSLFSAALHVAAANFNLADLINVDANKVHIAAFESQLRDQVAGRMREVYGVEISQVGIERMTLPTETLAATVARMRAERETVAAERTAEGLRQAAVIRADADRDGRKTVSEAHEKAAEIVANAEQEAARINAKAYHDDPQLYSLLRSLDTLGNVVGRSTTMVLRSDAAPFRALVEGPAASGGAKK
jgi:membrane protease subunit HflC